MPTSDPTDDLIDDEESFMPQESLMSRIRNNIISFFKKFKPKIPEKKTSIEIAAEQVANRPRIIVKDKLILSMALLVGMIGAVIIYNQMPTHVMVVVGIICICFSFSVITGISRW